MKNYLVFLFLIILIAPIVYSQVSDLDPVRLENILNRREFYPTEILQVQPRLYNQNSDLVLDTAQVIFLDPEGKEVIKEVIQTNERVSYEFSQFALPGKWIVKTYTAGRLYDIDEIFVLENTLVDANFKDGLIFIRNMGNMDYSEDIRIDVFGEKDTVIIKKTFLKPGQAIEIDLSEDLDNGVYDLVVTHDGVQREFNDVAVGNIVLGEINYYAIAAILIVLIVAAYLIFTKKERVVRRNVFSKQYFDRLEKKPESTVPYVFRKKEEKPKIDLRRLGYGWRRKTEEVKPRSLQHKESLKSKYK